MIKLVGFLQEVELDPPYGDMASLTSAVFVNTKTGERVSIVVQDSFVENILELVDGTPDGEENSQGAGLGGEASAMDLHDEAPRAERVVAQRSRDSVLPAPTAGTQI